MLIDFSITNFRSIKDEQHFSMQAEANKNKLDNTFELTLQDGSKLRLAKSSVVYGANSSGKTNFILALYALRYFVTHSDTFKVDKKIECYEPFELESGYESKPTKLRISFIAKDLIKYRYLIEYGRTEIYSEKLFFYPKGQRTILFERVTDSLNIDRIKFGKSLKNKPKRTEVFKNQLYLSKFGSDEPNQQLTPIYKYFNELEIWKDHREPFVSFLQNKISKELTEPNNEYFAKKLNKLIKIADTKIESISVKEASESDFEFPDFFTDDLKKQIIEQNRIKTFAKHILYNNGKEAGFKEFDIDEESAGTKLLFSFGGLILKKLETGGVIIFDELDNSLHPRLCKFLVRLFNNPVSNPKNAQLIFATYEVTLLDRDIFRKDQIWFTEKNQYGQTELFSAKDVAGLRDDTNFELWYRTGKFGGNPKIKEVEFIFGDE